MSIKYVSTRDRNNRVNASEAILQGLASDGGLYVPESIPQFDFNFRELSDMSYQQIAYEVMKLYLDDFTEEELKGCILRAYDIKFDDPLICPLHKADGAFYIELFHGRTIAFKDMALSILPHLMTTAATKNNDSHEIVILTATSGDTGKAALEGFADIPGTRIIVFYPRDGVSEIQERQMVTQKGDNTFVVGIRGNFDQAQTGVKKMFNDQMLAGELESSNFRFSSANSINIGRLVPQIVYYVASYARLLGSGAVSDGEKVNIVVPTGNFGNILAAYYAKLSGLPVAKLICASNENKVLFDFFETGIYDRNREFVLTSSPSMDILISSNLERLIYRLAGEDDASNRRFMESLVSEGRYEITEAMREKLFDFYGGYATEEETASTIKRIFESDDYILDTHTAVAAAVYDRYRRETGDKAVSMIASTASPYKFTRSVMRAIGADDAQKTDMELTDRLHEISRVDIPPAIEEIRNAPIRHDTVCEVDQMPDVVKKFLGI